MAFVFFPKFLFIAFAISSASGTVISSISNPMYIVLSIAAVNVGLLNMFAKFVNPMNSFFPVAMFQLNRLI